MIATLLLDCKLCEGSNWVSFCFLRWKSFANMLQELMSVIEFSWFFRNIHENYHYDFEGTYFETMFYNILTFSF